MEVPKKMDINKQYWLVILLGVLTAFDPLTIDMYLPAFLLIEQDLKTNISLVELSVTLFFIGMATGQLVYGPLSDKYGRKKPLIGGMILYFAATIGCALANHIGIFLFFRLLQAFGGCASMVISRAIIRDLFEKKEVAMFLSNLALVMGIAPILAPSIGAFISQFFGWRAIFYFLASANLLCIFISMIYLPETNIKKNKNLNLKQVISSYLSFFSERSFIGYLIPDMAVRAGMFAYIAGSPFIFISLFKLTPSEYGIVFGINGLGLLLAAQINRRLLNRYSPEEISAAAIKVAFIASCILFFFSSLFTILVFILVPLFIFIACLNFISPNTIAIALNQQSHQAGTASAFYGCFQWSMACIASLMVSIFHDGSAIPMAATIFVCGIFSLLGFQILIQTKKLQPKN